MAAVEGVEALRDGAALVARHLLGVCRLQEAAVAVAQITAHTRPAQVVLVVAADQKTALGAAVVEWAVLPGPELLQEGPSGDMARLVMNQESAVLVFMGLRAVAAVGPIAHKDLDLLAVVLEALMVPALLELQTVAAVAAELELVL